MMSNLRIYNNSSVNWHPTQSFDLIFCQKKEKKIVICQCVYEESLWIYGKVLKHCLCVAGHHFYTQLSITVQVFCMEKMSLLTVLSTHRRKKIEHFTQSYPKNSRKCTKYMLEIFTLEVKSRKNGYNIPFQVCSLNNNSQVKPATREVSHNAPDVPKKCEWFSLFILRKYLILSLCQMSFLITESVLSAKRF